MNNGRRVIESGKPAKAMAMRLAPDKDAVAWLRSQAADKQLAPRWLLAHAYDGVIWGKVDGGFLVTSFEASDGFDCAADIRTELRAETLQQARLFGPGAELFLWRDGREWRARAICDTDLDPDWTEFFDESYMLWGTADRVERLSDTGFTLVTEGMRGVRQILPVSLTPGEDAPLMWPRLRVRHYLNPESEGFARVVATRLVDLEEKPI